MRLWALTLILLLTASTAAREKTEPDVVTISGNTIESPYFKFHYSFPQGWQTQDDKVRMENNREKHRKAGAGHWTYNLLLASPEPISAYDKLSLPYIHILAIEGAQDLFGNGNYRNFWPKRSRLLLCIHRNNSRLLDRISRGPTSLTRIFTMKPFWIQRCEITF